MANGNDGENTAWGGPRGAVWAAMAARIDATHAPVTAELVRRAGIAPGMEVLDVGCGAGASSRAAARAGARVTGLDISAPLLAEARARAEAEAATAAAGAIRFDLGDAQNADLGAAAYDRILSQFGVMFFADSTAAFANLHRAARPGARLVLAAWAGPEHNPWFTRPGAIAAAETAPAPSDPDGPGPMRFRDIGRVTAILAAAGWQDATGTQVDLHLTPPGTAEEVALALTRVGGASRILDANRADDTTRARVAALIRDSIADWETPGGIRVPARVNFFTATG